MARRNALLEGLMTGLAQSMKNQNDMRTERERRRMALEELLAQNEAVYQQQQQRRPGEFARRLEEDEMLYERDQKRKKVSRSEELRFALEEDQQKADAARKRKDEHLKMLLGDRGADGKYAGGRFSDRLNALPPEVQADWLAQLEGLDIPDVMNPELAALLGAPTQENLQKAYAIAARSGNKRDMQAFEGALKMFDTFERLGLARSRASAGGGRGSGGSMPGEKPRMVRLKNGRIVWLKPGEEYAPGTSYDPASHRKQIENELLKLQKFYFPNESAAEFAKARPHGSEADEYADVRVKVSDLLDQYNNPPQPQEPEPSYDNMPLPRSVSRVGSLQLRGTEPAPNGLMKSIIGDREPSRMRPIMDFADIPGSTGAQDYEAGGQVKEPKRNRRRDALLSMEKDERNQWRYETRDPMLEGIY